MATFSEVAGGVRTRRATKLPLPGASLNVETGDWEGPTVPLDLRALNEAEYETVLEEARKFARKRGLESPESGDDLYERGKIVHTLAIACIDRDSPEEDPKPFFDGKLKDGSIVPAWQQIQQSEILTPEVLGYLYEHQQLLQEDVAPMKKELTPAELMAGALATARGNMGFFVGLRPGTRWSFVRILANRFIDSLAPSSPSSTSSEPPTTTPN